MSTNIEAQGKRTSSKQAPDLSKRSKGIGTEVEDFVNYEDNEMNDKDYPSEGSTTEQGIRRRRKQDVESQTSEAPEEGERKQPWVRRNIRVLIQLLVSFLVVSVLYYCINWIYHSRSQSDKKTASWSIADIEYIFVDKLLYRYTNKDYITEVCNFLNENVHGNVLEVGACRGFAMHCLEPSNIERYSAVDTNAFAFKDLEKRFNVYLGTKGVKKGDFLPKSAADMHEIPDKSIDTVFAIRTLCSVQDGDMDGVLHEIQRVLKPGGKFIFAEHVADWKETTRKRIQRLIAPLWKVIFRGCQFKEGKSFAESLEKLGFTISMRNTYLPMFPYKIASILEPQVFGIAVKNQEGQ